MGGGVYVLFHPNQKNNENMSVKKKEERKKINKRGIETENILKDKHAELQWTALVDKVA